MASACMYPGQGSQSVGMGRSLAAVSPEARAVWETADEALGEPISRLAWEGPVEDLDRTANAQPALLAASIAAHRALQAALGPADPAETADAAIPADDAVDPPLAAARAPRFRAGHSMGQYSAMVAAGVLDLGDAIRLVRERGRLMQASSGDGAMAAIIGLPDERVDDLLAAGAGAGIIVVANRNSTGQIVLSGERTAVAAAVDASRGLGARRGMLLPVSVAAHSPLMAEAAEGMRRALAAIAFADPDVPLLANADASLLTTGEACRAELVEHLTRGVDWVRAVEVMSAAGADTFLEVGPGKVLAGLVRRIAPEASIIAIDDITTEDGLRMPATASTQE